MDDNLYYFSSVIIISSIWGGICSSPVDQHIIYLLNTFETIRLAIVKSVAASLAKMLPAA